MLEPHKQQTISIKSARLIIFTVLGIFILVAATIGSSEINEDTRQNQELAKVRKERDEIRTRNNTLRSQLRDSKRTTGQWKDEACKIMGEKLEAEAELEILDVKRLREVHEKQKEVNKLQQELIGNGTEVSRGVERSGIPEGDSRGKYLGEFRATAYNGAEPGGGGSKTASGTKVGFGTVATDSKVIPLGTRIFIEGYGEGIALDVGGAIKGHRIDVWFDSVAKCNQWGVKTVKVWRIE